MIDTLATGLAVTVIGALLIYLFKIKQLYLVVPRLFSNSLLSNKGKLVEIRIFNRSWNTETDIMVGLDPAVLYEIVASTDNTSTINDSNVFVPRVPPGDDYSVLLLVEGEFTNERISGVSSSTTKGRIIKDLGNVPPNFGKAFLVTLLMLLFVTAPITGIEIYKKFEESEKREYLVNVENALGNKWGSLEDYVDSEFGKNYSLGEFPVNFLGQSRVGDRVLLNFRLTNKAAASLKVDVSLDPPFYESDPEPWKASLYEYKIVPPASSQDFQVVFFWPKGTVQDLELPFSLAVGAEKYISVIYHVETKDL